MDKVHISDAETKKLAKKLEAAVLIHSNPGTIKEASFLHSIFCQLGLPRSAVNAGSFVRECGGASILIEAGSLWDGEKWVKQIVPYGPTPRLILTFINSYAVKNRTPIINIGSSQTEFLTMLGHAATGGKNGTIQNFKKQIQAIAACSVSVGINAAGISSTYQGKPVKIFAALTSQSLWPTQIILSDEYFFSLTEKSVPLDSRSLVLLKDSALSMDVYCWLAERLHRIEKRPALLHWRNLIEQFGQEYSGKDATKNFKKVFLPALERAKGVYPEAKVDRVKTGFLLYKSPPPIPYRD